MADRTPKTNKRKGGLVVISILRIYVRRKEKNRTDNIHVSPKLAYESSTFPQQPRYSLDDAFRITLAPMQRCVREDGIELVVERGRDRMDW
jgi:hypothetical protein